MIDEEVRNEAIAALSAAAGELVEDSVDELLTRMPVDPDMQLGRMTRLKRLGRDLAAFGEAGIALIERSLAEIDPTAR